MPNLLSSSHLFPSASRTQRFLDCFNNMNPQCQKALRTIYTLAMHPRTLNHHILMAMRMSVYHPKIFRLAVQSISLRMSLKIAIAKQHWQTAHRIESTIEDFHIALDAFMQDISIAEATQNRREKQPRHLRLAQLPPQVDPMLKDIASFQSMVKPMISRFRQSHSRRRHLKPVSS